MLAEGDARFVRGFDTAMLHPGTQVQHALTATLVAVLLGACTAHDPIADVAPADMRCPELSGSYCAAGRMYDRSQTQLLSARLQWFLPLQEDYTALGQEIRNADRVDFTGGHDGRLNITLLADGEKLYSIELDASQFRCGTDTLLLENTGEMWGGIAGAPVLPIIAAGWSDAHSLFWKGSDGSLRVRKLQRNSGAVMLAIPVNFNEEFWARFKPAEDGCEQR